MPLQGNTVCLLSTSLVLGLWGADVALVSNPVGDTFLNIYIVEWVGLAEIVH